MSLACSNGSIPRSDRPSLLSYPLIFAIHIYRLTLSPLMEWALGTTCRFEPSCSRYAEQAIRMYGPWRGSIMAVKRLARCHPWHEGGYDPVE